MDRSRACTTGRGNSVAPRCLSAEMTIGARFADEVPRRISSPSASLSRERGILLIPWSPICRDAYTCDNGMGTAGARVPVPTGT